MKTSLFPTRKSSLRSPVKWTFPDPVTPMVGSLIGEVGQVRSPDETSFEHYASQLTDSQLNGITGMDYDIIIKEEDSSQSPMRKGMETLEL